MTPQNDMCPICSYGSSAQYCSWPSDEQRRTGVVPLDSLPAAWWNNMWADATNRINEARDMVGQLITELNSVLAQAGICPQAACTDQLYQSINKIRQTLATSTVAGSVVGSADTNKVAVAADGTMTVNCFGNAAALTTTASTVVGAINELKSTYDCCISDLNTAVTGLGTSKAPNNHASDQTTYGVGSATAYGHLKISDSYSAVLTECSGVAASQYALATVYTCLAACAGAPLGNTAGCALGTAAAGSCSTAARSDHVHPMPTCVACAGAGPSGTAFGTAAYCAAGCFRASTWTPTCVCCAGRDGSGCAFGTAARYACGCFRPSTWTPSCVDCAGRAQRISNAWCTLCISSSGICSICNRCNFPILAFACLKCGNCNACYTLPPLYIDASGKTAVSNTDTWSRTCSSCIQTMDGIRLF